MLNSTKIGRETFLYLFVHTILIILIGIGNFTSFTLLASVTVILIFVVTLFEPIEENLYLIIMLAPFENLMTIDGKKVFSIVFIIYLLKAIFRKGVIREKNIVCFGFAILLSVFEMFNEFTLSVLEVSPFALVNTISYVFFFFTVIFIIDSVPISLNTIILSFNITILVTIVATFSSYGSISAFVSYAQQSEYVVRLGKNTFDTLGGAMGIPLYAALLVSINVVYLTLSKGNALIKKIFIIGITALSIIFGALSVSRAFYLCFGVFAALYCIINFFQKKKYGFAALVTVLTFGIIIFFLTSDTMSWLLNNLLTRQEQDSGLGIRGQIWQSCIEFLFQHPRRLFMGMSSNCYGQYGELTNQLFSYTAHNFLLDIIMSFGLVGLFMLAYMLKILMRKLRERYGKIDHPFAVLPFVILLTFGLTALRTATGKTWIFLVFTVLFMYIMRSKNNEIDS